MGTAQPTSKKFASKLVIDEELIPWFNSSCQDMWDSVAPLKTVLSKPTPEPWYNDRARVAKQKRRKAEPKWKER